MLLCCFFLTHHFPEETEKDGDGDDGSGQIRHRLRQEHGKGLVLEKRRKNENQRDQKNQLSQAGHEQAGFGLSQSYKGLLAGHLEPYAEATGEENPYRPLRIAGQLLVAGKNSCEEAGKQLDEQPEHGCIGNAGKKLAEEGFFYPVKLICAIVEADKGLPALTDACHRHGDQLVDGSQHCHGSDGHIAAVPGKRGGKADGQDALGAYHDKAGDTKPEAGQQHIFLNTQISGTKLQNGFLSGEEFQDPYGAD